MCRLSEEPVNDFIRVLLDLRPVQLISDYYQIDISIAMRFSIRVIKLLDRVAIVIMKGVNLRLCRSCYCGPYYDWGADDDYNWISKGNEREPASTVHPHDPQQVSIIQCCITDGR